MADDSPPAEIPTKADAAPAETPTKASPLRGRKRQIIGGALAIAVIAGTFVFVLPRIADYRDVWGVVKTLSWEQVLALLNQTKALVGDRAWGVGLLGFVPKELRDKQVEAIWQVKPPVALIAGGRPDQAAEFEARGIATYLHVPSPELLRMFIDQGARRFVFEGRECGGHVGPLGSLVLRLILDTGATTSVIKLVALRSLGIDPDQPARQITMATGSGIGLVPLVILTRLTALGQHRFGFPVIAHSLPPQSAVDGLLGLDFLRGHILTVDFQAGQLALS